MSSLKQDIENVINATFEIYDFGVSPKIIVSAMKSIDLRKFASSLMINYSSYSVIYHTFRTRKIAYSTSYDSIPVNVTPEHIIAAMARDSKSLSLLLEDINMYMDSSVFDMDLIQEYQQKEHFIITSIRAKTLHEYVEEMMTGRDISYCKTIYIYLRGVVNAYGKAFHPSDVMGAIGYYLTEAFERGHTKFTNKIDIHHFISNFENTNSRNYLPPKKIDDLITEYRKLLNTPPGFDYEELEHNVFEIDSYEPSAEIDIYDLNLELDRTYIRSVVPLDIISVINDAITSVDIPLIIGYDSKRTPIIKISTFFEKYMDPTIIDPSDNDPETIHVFLDDKNTRPIKYEKKKNAFSFNETSQSMTVSHVLEVLWKNLRVNSLMFPLTSNRTFSFITNKIDKLNKDEIGKDILGFMIMNPPEEYSFLEDLLFVKEDQKVLSQRKHLTVHIQLGTEKMYLTIAEQITTKGTITLKDTINVGFEKGQEYFRIKVNRAASEPYARIARKIYVILIDMFLKYLDEYKSTIYNMTKINNIRNIKSIIHPLIPIDNIPLKSILRTKDRILFKGISSIEDSLLPVVIERNQFQEKLEQGYQVIRLPATIENAPEINIDAAREIWLTTPDPFTPFVLWTGQDGKHLPIAWNGKSSLPRLMVYPDFTLRIERIDVSSRDYILRSGSRKLMQGRTAGVSSELFVKLKEIFPDITHAELLRRGIGSDIIREFNSILQGSFVQNSDVAKWAHMCKQECYNQPVDLIMRDIDIGNIVVHKHWRAIEQAFNINLFFVCDSRVQLPEYSQFYLHRRADPSRITLILHSDEKNPRKYTLLVKNSWKKTSKNRPIDISLFNFDKPLELDQMVLNSNRITKSRNVLLHEYSFNPEIQGWKIIGQVIDNNGKCRCLTYQSGSNIATVNIGIAAPFSYPIGNIVYPCLGLQHPFEEKLVMYPSNTTTMLLYCKNERDSRILLNTTHLLFSESNLSPYDFVQKHIEVDRNVTYDTTSIRNLINTDIVTYMLTYNKSMVRLGEDNVYKIIVPSNRLLYPLQCYLTSHGKRIIPEEFPSLIKYTWDIVSSNMEKVYFSLLDLYQSIILSRNSKYETSIKLSVYPYILLRNRIFYSVIPNTTLLQISYITYRYKINKPCNPLVPIPANWKAPDTLRLHKISPDFSYTDRISYVEDKGVYFMIIPYKD